MQSSDGWVLNVDYQEFISTNMLPELTFDGPFDATNMATSPTSNTTSSPKVSSFSSNDGSSCPKLGSIGRPMRRRSRACKKGPTTLLNANTRNFRALVQQFTGCNSSPPVFGTYRGPINLNFSQYAYCSEKTESQHRREDRNILREESDQSLFSFGSTNNIAAGTTNTTTTATTISSSSPPSDDRGSFVSTVNCNPRSDPLTFDDFGMGNYFWSQDLSGTGDFSSLPGTSTNDIDFWGY